MDRVFIIPIVSRRRRRHLTLIGLSQGAWEAEPFVASAVLIGPWQSFPSLYRTWPCQEGYGKDSDACVGKCLFGVARPSKYMPFRIDMRSSLFWTNQQRRTVGLS